MTLYVIVVAERQYLVRPVVAGNVRDRRVAVRPARALDRAVLQAHTESRLPGPALHALHSALTSQRCVLSCFSRFRNGTLFLMGDSLPDDRVGSASLPDETWYFCRRKGFVVMSSMLQLVVEGFFLVREICRIVLSATNCLTCAVLSVRSSLSN